MRRTSATRAVGIALTRDVDALDTNAPSDTSAATHTVRAQVDAVNANIQAASNTDQLSSAVNQLLPAVQAGNLSGPITAHCGSATASSST